MLWNFFVADFSSPWMTTPLKPLFLSWLTRFFYPGLIHLGTHTKNLILSNLPETSVVLPPLNLNRPPSPILNPLECHTFNLKHLKPQKHLKTLLIPLPVMLILILEALLKHLWSSLENLWSPPKYPETLRNNLKYLEIRLKPSEGLQQTPEAPFRKHDAEWQNDFIVH